MARKILLADDSVTAQNMGRRILTDAGYEVITVNNGSAAMKKIAEIKPDLIVLDIYMPGYSGLEICQRIRETPEWARIPVLLTVGKLEPFKADDAKRVRADAFVIKPFEASELLTALTKLEDKIVPSGQSFSGGSFSGGRFARAVASLEELKSGKEFGDTDTGWKSRLKIPAPYSKPHESRPENQASEASPELADKAPDPKVEEKIEQKQTGNVASLLPEAVASALPHNVTPEEIEAIAAAAALLAGHADISADAPLGSNRHADVQEEAANRESTATTSAGSSDEASNASLASGRQEPSEDIPQNAREGASASETKPSSEISGDETGAEPQQQEAREDEVAAMLASLSPTIGKPRVEEVEELVPVTMAAGAGEYSGPRWIAEEAPVSEEESTLVLQLEMERAFAAFAAADAARMFHVEHIREAAYAENAPEMEDSAPATRDVASADISAPQRHSAPEPQIEEPIRAVEASPAESNLEGGGGTEAPQEEKAAYAVASAGWGASPASPSEYTAQDSAVEVSPSVPAADPASETRSNELAAAWASWKQVRESEAGVQVDAQPAESARAEAQRSGDEEGPKIEDAEPTEAEVSAQAAEDASEVASIVDSVLADLKPKLMKEIAQKIGKSKKKKKHD